MTTRQLFVVGALAFAPACSTRTAADSDCAPPRVDLEGACVLDTSVLVQPPGRQWLDAEATVVVNGVEFIDPDGALEDLDLTVERVDLSTMSPALTDGTEAWSIEPSMPLDAIVYVRFPLAEPGVPGDLLELYTHDGEFWDVQSAGVVSDDGRQSVFGLAHFSIQGQATPHADRRAFVDGTFCNGEKASGSAFAVGQHAPTEGEAKTVNPLGDDLPTHATMMQRLFHLAGDAALSDRVLFKNEENKGRGGSGCLNAAGKPGFESEDEYGIAELAGPVRRLGDRVRERSCGSLQLVVNEAFDTLGEHKSTSLHKEGRAVDLSLVPIKANGKADCNLFRYKLGLGRLAQLAAEQDSSVLTPAAAFDWVWFEHDHIHASMKGEPGPIEPPDSPVPAANEFSTIVTIDGEETEYTSDLIRRSSNGFDNLFVIASHAAGDTPWNTTLTLPDGMVNGTYPLSAEFGTEHVAISVTHEGVVYSSTSLAAAEGSITITQVPLADKDLFSVTAGEFEATVSDGTTQAQVRGTFSVDDLRFWEL